MIEKFLKMGVKNCLLRTSSHTYLGMVSGDGLYMYDTHHNAFTGKDILIRHNNKRKNLKYIYGYENRI